MRLVQGFNSHPASPFARLYPVDYGRLADDVVDCAFPHATHGTEHGRAYAQPVSDGFDRPLDRPASGCTLLSDGGSEDSAIRPRLAKNEFAVGVGMHTYREGC
jgi:hypothetical protein